MTAEAPQSKPHPIRPCPICGKPQQERFRPFCCKRCADVDLNRWLKGVYAVPAAEEDDPDEGEPGGSGER